MVSSPMCQGPPLALFLQPCQLGTELGCRRPLRPPNARSADVSACQGGSWVPAAPASCEPMARNLNTALIQGTVYMLA